jgi:hypothetical protein
MWRNVSTKPSTKAVCMTVGTLPLEIHKSLNLRRRAAMAEPPLAALACMNKQKMSSLFITT